MASNKQPDPTDKHVGSRVRMRRMMLGMSQTALGDGLGLTFQQVQKYEKGTNRIGASRLQQLAQILQVPVEFFFDGGPMAPIAGARPSDPVAELCASRDGLALATAFNSISDPKARSSLVALAEGLAQQKKAA
jgi:transcriptional regulator with XRE-family HTH domain